MVFFKTHLAEVIAIIALLLTVYQAYHIRKQNIITNKVNLDLIKFLDIKNSDFVTYKITLNNNGSGSAYINFIGFCLNQVKHTNSFTISVSDLAHQIKEITNLGVGHVEIQNERYELHPKSSIELISFSGLISKSNIEKLKVLNDKLSFETSYDTEYSSGLGFRLRTGYYDKV